MKIKTSELTGAALDWAVAKCETSWSSNTKQIVLKDRETNFIIIPAEQVLAAAATQKLLGE